MKRIALLSLVAFMAMGTAYADIDNLDIGGDLMAEYFFSSELQAVDSETDFLRTEGHLWFQADLDDNVMARISLEFDRALDNFNAGGTNNLGFGGLGNLDLFLEEAFIKVADISGSGLSLSVGRQFLNFGDNSAANDFNGWWGPGFIISDGNPGSPASIAQLGSYEIDPFDAIVASYEMETASVDVIYGRAAEDFSANNNDDIAVTALYGSYFGIEGHQIDAYFSWTDDNSNNPFSADESMIVGARAAGDIMPELAYKVEVAYQFEDDNNPLVEVDALAIQAGINYHPELDYNPNIGFIYTFLEGDNGGGFAAMDGKTYGLLIDSVLGAGQMTNANIFNLNGGWEPMQDVAWTADLYYIMLDEDVMVAGLAEDDGGFEIDTQIDYQFNDNLTTFLGGGVYFLGDVTGRDDEAYFFRTGMKVNF